MRCHRNKSRKTHPNNGLRTVYSLWVYTNEKCTIYYNILNLGNHIVTWRVYFSQKLTNQKPEAKPSEFGVLFNHVEEALARARPMMAAPRRVNPNKSHTVSKNAFQNCAVLVFGEFVKKSGIASFVFPQIGHWRDCQSLRLRSSYKPFDVCNQRAGALSPSRCPDLPASQQI